MARPLFQPNFVPSVIDSGDFDRKRGILASTFCSINSGTASERDSGKEMPGCRPDRGDCASPNAQVIVMVSKGPLLIDIDSYHP